MPTFACWLTTVLLLDKAKLSGLGIDCCLSQNWLTSWFGIYTQAKTLVNFSEIYDPDIRFHASRKKGYLLGKFLSFLRV